MTDPIVLTTQQLMPLFDMPLRRAAERLGVSATALKGICRKLEIKRWPFQETRWRAARADNQVLRTQADGSSFEGMKGAKGKEAKESKPNLMDASIFAEHFDDYDVFSSEDLLLGLNSPLQPCDDLPGSPQPLHLRASETAGRHEDAMRRPPIEGPQGVTGPSSTGLPDFNHPSEYLAYVMAVERAHQLGQTTESQTSQYKTSDLILLGYTDCDLAYLCA